MSPIDQKTKEILRKVRQIEIRTNRMVTDAMTGAYHSVFKGQGIDFEEVREYTIGDDVRSIDWNVTARMDRTFVKKFKEERELTILLMVDVSASGDFGSADHSKRELAAEVASVLAFSALRNNDKVGLLLFSERIEKLIIPRKGRQHILRLIREILFHTPTGRGTDIAEALTTANRLLKRKAILFLISDFLQDRQGRLPDLLNSNGDNPLLHTLRVTNQRHDLTCLISSDPREHELPAIGVLTLEDSETGELIEINTSSKSVRNAYRRENASRRDILLRGLRRTGVGLIELTTDQPYITRLRTFFEKRGARR